MFTLIEWEHTDNVPSKLNIWTYFLNQNLIVEYLPKIMLSEIINAFAFVNNCICTDFRRYYSVSK